MKSFSQEVKKELFQNSEKIKTCCLYSFLYGLCYFSKLENDTYFIKTTNVENKKILFYLFETANKKNLYEIRKNRENILVNKGFSKYFTIAEYQKNLWKENDCKANFMKAVFLTRGTVSNPEKSYRLDLSFREKEDAKAIKTILDDIDLSPNETIRNHHIVLYYKDRTKVEDFLAYIGANQSSFELMNKEIYRELRNNANRVANCDSANITKSVNAVNKLTIAIEGLKANGNYEKMPDELKEAGKIRLAYPEIPLGELGEKFTPPLTKSGIYHRLDKIIKFYENTKK